MQRLFRAAALLLLATCAFAADTTSLPFQHDDYAKAVAEARQKNLPVFVEVSAPW